MIRPCLCAIAVVAALSAPRPVRVRTTMRYVQLDEPRRTQAMNAFNRGLYQDSLIAPFADRIRLPRHLVEQSWCKGASSGW